MSDIAFDWGIENTTSGGKDSLEAFINDDVATASPEDIIPSDEDVTEDKTPKPTKKAKPKQLTVSDLFDGDDEEDTSDEPDESTEDDTDEESEVKPKTKKATKAKEVEDTASTEESEDESDADTEEEGDKSKSNVYSSFSRDLIKLGILEEDEELAIPETGEELLERMTYEKQKGVQNFLEGYLSRFGQDRVDLFMNIYEKGVDPKTYLESFVRAETVSQLDMEKPANQEKVVRQAYKNQGMDPEDIDSEVERLKEYGDLEGVSKKFQKVLVKQEQRSMEEQAKQSEQALKQEQQRIAFYNQSVSTILNDKLKQRTFDGLAVTPKVRDQVENFLTAQAYTLGNGETITPFDAYMINLQKPENYELKVKIALLCLNNFDLTKVAKSATTEKTNELFQSLATNKKTIKNKSGKSSKTASDESDLFTSLFQG